MKKQIIGKMKKQGRQGDILLEVVSKKINNLVKKARVVFARGEVTGHNHELDRCDDVGVLEDPVDNSLAIGFTLTTPAAIVHEDHIGFELPVNETIERIQQLQYDPVAVRRAAD